MRFFKGPTGQGVWVSKNKKFFVDYKPKAPLQNEFGERTVDVHNPNPDAVRLAIMMQDDTGLAAPLGSKQGIAKCGRFLMRELDSPPLLIALEKIERLERTVEEALYKRDKDDRVATFDIYPMVAPTERHPKGFSLATYSEKPLRSDPLCGEAGAPAGPTGRETKEKF